MQVHSFLICDIGWFTNQIDHLFSQMNKNNGIYLENKLELMQQIVDACVKCRPTRYVECVQSETTKELQVKWNARYNFTPTRYYCTSQEELDILHEIFKTLCPIFDRNVTANKTLLVLEEKADPNTIHAHIDYSRRLAYIEYLSTEQIL